MSHEFEVKVEGNISNEEAINLIAEALSSINQKGLKILLRASPENSDRNVLKD